jgi:predicted alpha/beta hydrolase family esterase
VRSLLLVSLVLVAGVVCGCGSDAPPDLSSGKKVDLGDWGLYIQCTGEGEPAVVLDAGLGDGHWVWERVERTVARNTRTCSYDRSGVGDSDVRPSKPAVVPAEQVVDELHELLDKAEIEAPYVLVGHSLGGLNARLSASRHREDLAGVVFVDPASPNYFGGGDTGPEGLGAAISYRTAYDTARSVTLRGLPVAVLVSAQQRAISVDEARELARRSSNILIVKTDTGHGIHFVLPRLVAEATNLVVESARSDSSLPQCRETQLAQLGGQCLR